MGSNETSHYDAIVVGAGFSGIYGLHKLRAQGLSVKVFEAGGDLGGAWYWNRYPGARVDSEWPHYQLSLPELWTDWYFSERFPEGAEIRRYFDYVDKKLDSKKNITFNARVNSANWDASRAVWTVTTEAGHVASCKYLCLFTGLLHRKHFPEFPGFENFKGKVYHPSAYPEDVDVTGKKVAVIGTGATAVQIIQELSKKASDLTVFLRRSSICLPAGNRPIGIAEQDAWKPYYHVLFGTGRKSASGFPMTRPSKNFAETSDEEREELYENLWKAGSFNYGGGNFPEMLFDKHVSRVVYDFWAKKTRARMSDPVKRDLMAPIEPPHPFMTCW